MKSRDLLRAAGEALFGAEFRPQLADALGARTRHVQRWLAGDEPVPAVVWRDLEGLVIARGEVLRRVESEVSVAGWHAGQDEEGRVTR